MFTYCRDSDFLFQEVAFSVLENLEFCFNWAEKCKFCFAINFVHMKEKKQVNSVYIRIVYKNWPAKMVWQCTSY